MSAMLLLGLIGLGAAEVPEEDRPRLEAVKKSLAAWRARADTCDVYYELETVHTPEGVGKRPLFLNIVEPVLVRTKARLARCGGKRFSSSGGQILSDTGPVPHRREAAFDGEHTLTYWAGDRQIRLERGRNRAGGVATPTALVRLDGLLKDLLEERDPSLGRITLSPRGDGQIEIALHWPSVAMTRIYVVEADAPHVIRSYREYVGDEVLEEASGIRYHEFPGGILYPVEGTLTNYERGTGKLAEQVTFRVDTERTRIDPPGGIPDEVFRVTIPEGPSSSMPTRASPSRPRKRRSS